MAVTDSVPFVGRERESAQLEAALQQAKESRGGTWVATGPAGIGKTRLLQWMDEQARARGFETRWAYCLKEANDPFFPFAQIFRTEVRAPLSSRPDWREPADLPTVLFYEEEKPAQMLERTVAMSTRAPTLLITRERESTMRQRQPGLSPKARIVWLARVEAHGALNPSSLDMIGQVVALHFEEAPGSIVAIGSLEYLISQNSFLPVLKLVQFLRDSAEATGGHLLTSVNPLALDRRELALLEGEGEIATAGKAGDRRDSQEPEPPTLTMLRYLHTLEGWCRRAPQLIFVDDLQWADPQSLQAVQFLARNIRALPLLIVGSVREGETVSASEARESSLVDTLDAMQREGTLTLLPVRPLEGSAPARLCAEVLGAPPLVGRDPDSLQSVLDKAAGNPYYLLEMLRQLRADGALAETPEGVRLTTPKGSALEAERLPDTLQRLVARRLKGLTGAERDLLELAAIAGREFEPDVLAAVQGHPAEALSGAIEGLLAQHLVVPGREGTRHQLSFAHPILWEGTFAEVPENRLRPQALLLAGWYAAHRADDVERIARLYYLAKEPKEGVRWVRKAIEHATLERADRQVERYHRWLQELFDRADTSPEERLRIGLETALGLYVREGRNDVVDRIIASLAVLHAPPHRLDMVRALQAFMTSHESPELGLEQAAALETEMAERGGTVPPLVNALVNAVEGNARFARGDFHGSLQAYQRAFSIRDPEVPKWFQTRLCYDIGWVAREIEDEPTYKEAMTLGQTLAEELGADRFRAFFLNLEALTCTYRGELQRAEEVMRRYIGMLRSVGNVSATAITLWDLANLYLILGSPEKARSSIEEGRTLASAFGFTMIKDLFLVPAGRVDLLEGRLAEAEEKLSAAVQRIRATNATGPIGFVQLHLAAVRLARGDLPGADKLLAVLTPENRELHPHDRPFRLRLLAALARAQHSGEVAVGQARAAVGAARELHDVVEEAHALAELARCETAIGEAEHGTEHARQAAEMYARTGAAPLRALPYEPSPPA